MSIRRIEVHALPFNIRRSWTFQVKFRFRVKTLLLATTVIAALVWAYWIALPDWQEYQQRKAFEQAVAQLEVGPERSLFEALDPQGPELQRRPPNLQSI